MASLRHSRPLTMAAATRRCPQQKSSVRRFSAAACNQAPAAFQGEPSEPRVVTSSVPGPKVKEGLAKLEQVFDTRSANTLVDYEKSIGN